jgi:hypothetical protein
LVHERFDRDSFAAFNTAGNFPQIVAMKNQQQLVPPEATIAIPLVRARLALSPLSGMASHVRMM